MRLFFPALFWLATVVIAEAADIRPADTSKPLLRAPPSAEQRAWLGRVSCAIAEQFTHSGTLQFEGEEVANPTRQYLDSSITQIVGSYRITPRFALQLNVPLIYRSFERPKGFAIEYGNESGLGDVSLLADAVVFMREWAGRRMVDFSDPKAPRIEVRERDLALTVSLLGGVKFPSGDTSRLKEESNEVEIPDAPGSGIHGHDLTLGTGSFDGIFGAQIATRYRQFFFEAGAFYTLRTEGAHHYEYADDMTCYGGPGLHFVRNQHTQLSLQLLITSGHKDRDRFRGEPVGDTALTSVFLGPRVLFSLGKWNGNIGVALPVALDNSSLRVVPDYVLQGSLWMRF